jgi:hypothetical protein
MCNDNVKHALLPLSSYLCSIIDEYYMREGNWNGNDDNCCDKYFIDFYYFFIPCSFIVDTILFPYNICSLCNKQNKVNPEI